MNLKIAHVSGSRSGVVEHFDRESVMIGRGGQNDLAFDPFRDAVVSSQHAEIRRESDSYYLYDMGSLNGTYLNGCPVQRARLAAGDEIGLGRRGPRLLFDVDPAQARKRPSSVPMSIPKMSEPTLRTKPEFAIPEIEEQVASRRPSTWVIAAVVVGALAILSSLVYGLLAS
ncbi:MAG: FHA domain-containing protein [Planctomycetota bacterium]